MLDRIAVRKSWIFLGAITAVEAVTILLVPAFLAIAFRDAASVPIAGWAVAAAVTLVTIAYTTNALNIGRFLLLATPFQFLGLLIAVPSSILEEVFFRSSLMNGLAHAGQNAIVQVIASSLAFGIVHAIWAVRGGWRSLVSAVLSTSVLGALLAGVFLASNRIVFPCVVAHFIINLVLEPWMGYAYALRQGVSVNRSAAAASTAASE